MIKEVLIFTEEEWSQLADDSKLIKDGEHYVRGFKNEPLPCTVVKSVIDKLAALYKLAWERDERGQKYKKYDVYIVNKNDKIDFILSDQRIESIIVIEPKAMLSYVDIWNTVFRYLFIKAKSDINHLESILDMQYLEQLSDEKSLEYLLGFLI